MKKNFDVSVMPPLPGDIRELVLFQVQDLMSRLTALEDLLCLTEEEEENGN